MHELRRHGVEVHLEERLVELNSTRVWVSSAQMHRLHVSPVDKVSLLLGWQKEAIVVVGMLDGRNVGLVVDERGQQAESVLLDCLHLASLHPIVRLQIVRHLAIALLFLLYNFLNHDRRFRRGWSSVRHRLMDGFGCKDGSTVNLN